jgi:pimeloyl-ACP methyl ester carboxylesterase
VVCLAGITRNSRDFHDLATALSQHRETSRDVYAIDCRGRGASERDRDWKNYSLLVELDDVLDFMTMKGLHDAAIVGTSRGGLLAMMMAVLRPGAIGAVVLNDIGPVVERDGLARIVAYVGRIPLPADWREAAALVRDMNERQFTAVADAQWDDVARAWFNDENGLPASGYDRNLARALSLVDGPMPQLWPQFAALSRVPALVVRGANSDVLSGKTVTEMQARHPRLTAITVPGQGHAPLLKDAPTIGIITEFLAHSDPNPQALGAPVHAVA